MAGGPKRSADGNLAALLAAGNTVARAAEGAGVSEKTARRRLADPEFQQLVAEHRTSAIGRSYNFLASATVAAASCVLEIAKDRDAPRALRLSASRTILELAIKGNEVLDLLPRLARLEQMLKDKERRR